MSATGNSPGFARQCLLTFVGAAILSSGSPVLADQGADASPEVSREQLLDFLVDHSVFTLIDARTPAEFDAAHIDGAVNVPVVSIDDLSASLPEDRDEQIVVYCKTGQRAALLQSRLKTRGYTDVRVLKSDQIFWFDGLAVFNCSTPSSASPVENLASGLMEESK